MKTNVTILLLFLLLFPLIHLCAQSVQDDNYIVPYKPDKSPLFGFDTYINNQLQQNQRNIVICSAFNGWLYGAYNYFDNSVQNDRIVIVRSKDNGVSWSVIHDGTSDEKHLGYTKMDILACGHDTTNLKVFVGSCMFDTLSTYHTSAVVRYDKNGIGEDYIFYDDSRYIRDLALASDDLYQANNSNPFSLAVVYSKRTDNGDSIVFYSSSNGGMYFDSHYNLAGSSYYFRKVALAYGRSSSCSSGRYFAAWEKQDNVNSVSGHIFTSHSEPNFNSPFTAPVLLDSLDASTANMASYPVIACQSNVADNDSSNFTEVILFEKYVPATFKYNIAGCYNKKATNSNNFQKFTIDDSGNNKLQPDICFNAFDSTFIVTYFDSTAQKLPYFTHNFNLIDPDSWVELSAGYNDDNNLVAPRPQVVMDFEKQNGVNAWIGARSGGHGAAMFDSPFTYYTGGSEKNMDINKLMLKIFPNPASEFEILEFELPRIENVNIDLLSPMGQSLSYITYPSCNSGKHQVRVDLTKYSAGLYIININAGNSFCSGKISITR